MREYKNLMDAAKIIENAKKMISREDGLTFISPAWSMLYSAERYLTARAMEALRGSK